MKRNGHSVNTRKFVEKTPSSFRLLVLVQFIVPFSMVGQLSINVIGGIYKKIKKYILF